MQQEKEKLERRQREGELSTLIFALRTKNGTSVCKGHEEPLTLWF